MSHRARLAKQTARDVIRRWKKTDRDLSGSEGTYTHEDFLSWKRLVFRFFGSPKAWRKQHVTLSRKKRRLP